MAIFLFVPFCTYCLHIFFFNVNLYEVRCYTALRNVDGAVVVGDDDNDDDS